MKGGTNRALFALWALFWLLMVVVASQDDRTIPACSGGSRCSGKAAPASSPRAGWCWSGAWRAAGTSLDDPLRWFGRHLAWLPLIIVTFIVAVYAIRHGVYALTGETTSTILGFPVFFYESLKLLLFSGLWLCIIFGLSSFALWQQERERLLALQKHLAESQLAQLKAQLQPHFLFNALNTISSLMQVDVERADRLLAQTRRSAALEPAGGRAPHDLAARGTGVAGAVRADHAGAIRGPRDADLEHRRRCARCRGPRHAAAAAARKRLQARRRAQPRAGDDPHRRETPRRCAARDDPQYRRSAGRDASDAASACATAANGSNCSTASAPASSSCRTATASPRTHPALAPHA